MTRRLPRELLEDAETRELIDRAPRSLSFGDLARIGAKIARAWRRARGRKGGRRARIELDPELRAFVDRRLEAMTLDQLTAACRERFGPERAPSRSSLERWRSRRRRERREVQKFPPAEMPQDARGPRDGR